MSSNILHKEGAPRLVSIVVDNQSWILPYAQQLMDRITQRGDKAIICRDHQSIQTGEIAFYLGCTSITPPEVLTRNQCNLVVHESDLPQGRGFAPLFWQILEGKNRISICLLEATNEVDAGPIIMRDTIVFDGHELNDEIRQRQGVATVSLCLRYMDATPPPVASPQNGQATYYKRRTPQDSRLDPDRTIREQFNLLRIVSNDEYPAFFEISGVKYTLKITKDT